MGFDLPTLYFLAIGTLMLSAGLTVWERQVRPARARQLGTLAAGYFILALACALATARERFPGALGPALCNLAMVGGYLLILAGVAGFHGAHHRTMSVAIMTALAIVWALAGERFGLELWSYFSAIPIAVACAATAFEIARNRQFRGLRSRRIAVAFAGGHALFYIARATVLPLAVAIWGPALLSFTGKLTMYEGVLFSVGLPMALLALMQEEAHEQLLETSRTDYLTALGNRRWFFEEGQRLIDTRTATAPLCLLAFDLDHFKTINDRFGHDTGDEMLKLFAGIARGAAGPDALIARIGGEEFAALLPGRSADHGRDIAQTIAARFAQASIVSDRGPVQGTVSIGLAELRPEDARLARMLSAADRALYLAKARGRNCVELAPPSFFAKAS